VQVLKYNANPAWGDAAAFFPAGNHASSGDPLWVWY
jgi:hypothetical protein